MSRIEVLALVVVTACGDSSADDGSSSMGETHGSLEGPGDGDPGDGDPGDGDGDPPPGCGDGMLDPGG